MEEVPSVRLLIDQNLREGSDDTIWHAARREGLVIVTRDSDFRLRSLAHGHPPKVIWLRTGNCSKATVEDLLRSRADDIRRFAADKAAGMLVLP